MARFYDYWHGGGPLPAGPGRGERLLGVYPPARDLAREKPGVLTCASSGFYPYARMLIARAITSAPITRDTAASVIISNLAHGLIAEMSTGLNAVAVQKPSDR
jgi:hypothetical protein